MTINPLVLLMVLATAIALIFISFSHAADITVCLDKAGKGYHSYRLIDGRKCWFRGEKVIPKDQLRWGSPPPKSVKPDEPVPLPPQRVSAPVTFDVRWRNLQQELAAPPGMFSPEPLVRPKLCDYMVLC